MRLDTEAAEAAALRASTASLHVDVKRRHAGNKGKRKLRLGSAHQGASVGTGFQERGALAAVSGSEGDEGQARSQGGSVKEVEGLLGDLDV